jgi:NAD(P)-dependent dehydrogenase (short-subunit alcohol dehydrogenase family)
MADPTTGAALVTGAGGGIGAAICARLAADGFPVIALDINPDAAGATVRSLEDAGGTAIAVQADLTNRDDIVRALDEAEQQLGPVTVLVNNAGALSIGPFEDIAESEWDKLMDVNLKAPFFLTQEFGRRAEAHGRGGAVVNIGSVAGVRAMMNRAHYCASKGGVQTLTQGMALELAPLGIRVNCINPKAILSGMSGRWVSATDGSTHVSDTTWLEDPAQRTVVLQSLPVGDHGQPADIADAVSFLVSDASGYMTGAVLDVDGGYLAGDMFTR